MRRGDVGWCEHTADGTQKTECHKDDIRAIPAIIHSFFGVWTRFPPATTAPAASAPAAAVDSTTQQKAGAIPSSTRLGSDRGELGYIYSVASLLVRSLLLLGGLNAVPLFLFTTSAEVEDGIVKARGAGTVVFLHRCGVCLCERKATPVSSLHRSHRLWVLVSSVPTSSA